MEWEKKTGEGVVTRFIKELSFVLEDRDYLLNCFDTSGVFSKVRFIAEERDDNLAYHAYYAGDIDFYSYEEEKTTIKVSVGQLGFQAMVEANNAVEYEIEFDAQPRISYDRLAISSEAAWESTYKAPGFFTAGVSYDVGLEAMCVHEESNSSDVEIVYYAEQHHDDPSKSRIAILNTATGMKAHVKGQLKFEFQWPDHADFDIF